MDAKQQGYHSIAPADKQLSTYMVHQTSPLLLVFRDLLQLGLDSIYPTTHVTLFNVFLEYKAEYVKITKN